MKNITPTITKADTEQWLVSKIETYQARIERLKAELKKAEIELRGHEVWLEDVRKKACHD